MEKLKIKDLEEIMKDFPSIVIESLNSKFLLNRRATVEFAFWVGLFWVAFLFWGLWCLQGASGFVTERHGTSQKG
jgi:hypothetical protein